MDRIAFSEDVSFASFSSFLVWAGRRERTVGDKGCHISQEEKQKEQRPFSPFSQQPYGKMEKKRRERERRRDSLPFSVSVATLSTPFIVQMAEMRSG